MRRDTQLVWVGAFWTKEVTYDGVRVAIRWIMAAQLAFRMSRFVKAGAGRLTNCIIVRERPSGCLAALVILPAFLFTK